MKTIKLLAFTAVIFLLGANAYAGWYNNSWQYRKAIVINSTVTVTSAQIPIGNSAGGFIDLVAAGNLKSDWGDVRFTSNDGVTFLNYWIPPDSSCIYVKVPSITKGKNMIFMYYGNSSASSAASFEGAMVPVATSDMYGLYYLNYSSADYSGQGNHMVFYNPMVWGTADLPRWKDYTIVPTTGSYLQFDGVTYHAQILANATMNTSKNLTVSFWINPTDYSVAREVVRKDNYDKSWKIFFPLDSGVPGRIEFAAMGRSVACYADNKAPAGSWSHVAATYDSTAKEMKLYVNGNLEMTKSSVADIGADFDALIQLSGSLTYKGGLDEIILSNRAYSIDEIKALYKRYTPIQAIASVEDPQEVSSFSGSTQVLRPGTATKFTYSFKEKMNTGVFPAITIWLPDNTKLSFVGIWADEYTYTATYTIPAGLKEGFVDIIMTDAQTAAGVVVGDFHSKMALASESLIPEGKKEFWPNPFSPNGDGFADKTTLFLNLDKASDIKVTIFNLQGTVIRHLFKGTANGSINIEWDGKDNSGEMAKIGLYIYQLEIGSSVTSGSIVLTK